MNDLEEILKKFDKEFTAIVEYHKWSDEDTIYKYDTPQYLWQDWIKNNPKPVKDFIQSAVKSRDERLNKVDYLEKLRLIKEWLPDMVSADIELVINMAIRNLKTNSIKEVQQMIRIANDPKTEELLSTLTNKKDEKTK